MFKSTRRYSSRKVLKNALWQNVFKEQTQILFDRMNSANGEKLKKTVTEGSNNNNTDYLDGFQYKQGRLSFFPTAEGYANVTYKFSSSGPLLTFYNYVYNYTDHLGNIRLRYTKDPQAETGLKILEEDHYYPFGLKHHGYNNEHNIFHPPIGTPHKVVIVPITPDLSDPYKYKYQGQERQDELGLNWDSFKWRNYDYAIGRFMSVDPLTEDYMDWGPYVFSGNRVIDARELEGLEPYVVTGRTFIPDPRVNNPYSSVMRTKTFVGDNRKSYQANTTAYRTEQKVRVDFEKKTATTLNNRASSTTGYDKEGNVTAVSDPGKAGPTPTYTPNTMDNGSTTINMQVDASNQLVSSPAINYDVNISLLEQKDGTFNYNISGQSDGFPAYEFFITDEATGDSYFIHGTNPEQLGSSAWDLTPPMEVKINTSGNSGNLQPVEEVKFD